MHHEAGHLIVKRLLAPGTADSHSLFTVEGEFLLEANVKANFSNRSPSQTGCAVPMQLPAEFQYNWFL